MNYKVSVSYIGTNFYGYAKQKNFRTIQGEIEKALKKIFKKDIFIISSGRTDKHVHAINQIFNFHLDKEININSIFFKLKQMLPKDIFINSVSSVLEDFHSRFSVKKKTYMYVINIDKFNFFEKDFVYQFNKNIDLNKLEYIKTIFIGEKNFLSFSSTENLNTHRNIYSIKINKKNKKIFIYITANGFLKYMVRFIIKKMLDYASGVEIIENILHLFQFPKKGSAAKLLPGNGLYLFDVIY